jgi:type I restriction enzyme R subunit
MNDLVADHVELFKMFQDDPSFRKFLTDHIFAATYRPEKGAGSGASTP